MKKSTRQLGLAVAGLVLIAGTAGPARAGITLESPWTGTFNGYYSTTNGQQIADYFVMPTTSAVQAISWNGNSVNDTDQGDLHGVASMDFRVRFYLDDLSLPVQARLLDHRPSLVPFYEADVTALVSPTGNESLDHQNSLFRFSASLGVPLTLNAGQTYWISLLGRSPSKEFAWALSAAGNSVFRPYPQSASGSSDGTAWYENANLGHSHLTYTLFDRPFPFPNPDPETSPNPVPEPAPIALAFASIPIGVDYLWRRRKARGRA